MHCPFASRKRKGLLTSDNQTTLKELGDFHIGRRYLRRSCVWCVPGVFGTALFCGGRACRPSQEIHNYPFQWTLRATWLHCEHSPLNLRYVSLLCEYWKKRCTLRQTCRAKTLTVTLWCPNKEPMHIKLDSSATQVLPDDGDSAIVACVKWGIASGCTKAKILEKEVTHWLIWYDSSAIFPYFCLSKKPLLARYFFGPHFHGKMLGPFPSSWIRPCREYAVWNFTRGNISCPSRYIPVYEWAACPPQAGPCRYHDVRQQSGGLLIIRWLLGLF